MLPLISAHDQYNYLLQTKGAYRENAERMMSIGLLPLYLTGEEFTLTKQRGRILYQVLDKKNQFYIDSINGRVGGHIAAIVEVGLDLETIKIQRIIATERPRSVWIRTDESKPGFIVEIQRRNGGLCWWTNRLDAHQLFFPLEANELSTDLTNGYVQPIIWLAEDAKTPFTVLITPTKDIPSQTWFANRLNQESDLVAIPVPSEILGKCINGTTLEITLELRDILDSPASNYIWPKELAGKTEIPIGTIYRRELNIIDFTQFRNFGELFSAYLKGDIIIQPELNVLADTKVGMGLYFDPEFQPYLTPEEQGLFPATAFMPQDFHTEFILGNQVLTLGMMSKMSRNERKIFVKYGGPNMYYSYGGRGVFRGMDGSIPNFVDMIKDVFGRMKNGHPWLIQEADITYYPMSYYNHETNSAIYDPRMHARICHHYFRHPDGRVTYCAADGVTRHHWKATSANDAVVAPVRVTLGKRLKLESHKQGFIRKFE